MPVMHSERRPEEELQKEKERLRRPMARSWLELSTCCLFVKTRCLNQRFLGRIKRLLIQPKNPLIQSMNILENTLTNLGSSCFSFRGELLFPRGAQGVGSHVLGGEAIQPCTLNSYFQGRHQRDVLGSLRAVEW